MVDGDGRILVVDDDDTIRSALQIALRQQGYEVRAESNGLALEHVAAEFHPDLAILDVRLGVGPDGYEMARVLRQTMDVPVMFLTAATGVDERLSGFRSGADDYVVKPFFMAELLARVEALLRRR